MRVLISAYLCAPGMGSEEEVAMQAIVAAATEHQVWALVHRDSAEDVRAEVERRGLASQVTVETLHIDPPLPGARDRALPVRHWAYDAWQKAAIEKVIELDREHNFDVVHHATIASYWTRCALAALDKPFVLGPVGGGVTCPPGLLSALGPRGAVGYLLRTATRHAFGRRPAVRQAWHQATIVLAQNQETADRFPSDCNVEVYSNAISGSVLMPTDSDPRNQDLIFAGRLLPWKGATLAVEALANVADSRARLFIYGDGPDKPRIQALATELGVRDRVIFPGRVERRELHAHLARAGAMVHPAVHEEGGLSMTEAMALGTPVVCLNRGGVVVNARQVPDAPVALIDAGRRSKTIKRMARAIDGFLEDPPMVLCTPARPDKTFGEMLLEVFDRAVEQFVPASASIEPMNTLVRPASFASVTQIDDVGSVA